MGILNWLPASNALCIGKEGCVAVAIAISTNTDHYYPASVQPLSVTSLRDRIMSSQPSGVTPQILCFFFFFIIISFNHLATSAKHLKVNAVFLPQEIEYVADTKAARAFRVPDSFWLS